MWYRCYAKVNFSLEILGKRDDGYHELVSLVHSVDMADDLHLQPSQRLLSRVRGLQIEPEANLVTRAARLLAASTGHDPGAELELVKRIPAAAGLGGGSSDAATTLVGLNQVWQTGLGEAELSGLAAQLGSDVPFFIRGGSALMAGRGDRLEALPALDDQWLTIVLAAPTMAGKTGQLYASLRPLDFSAGEAARRAARALERGHRLDADDLANAFERAARAVFPHLTENWRALEDVCQRRFCLSGAGPALFAFAADGADAARQQRRAERLGLAAFTARTVPHARDRFEMAAGGRIGYP